MVKKEIDGSVVQLHKLSFYIGGTKVTKSILVPYMPHTDISVVGNSRNLNEAFGMVADLRIYAHALNEKPSPTLVDLSSESTVKETTI